MVLKRPTYIRHLILVRVVENVVKHINGSLGLDGNSGTHSQAVDVLDKLLRASFGITVSFGRLGGGGVDGGLVVEAVQVAAGFLEILDPFLWLLEPVSLLTCVLFSRMKPSSHLHSVSFTSFRTCILILPGIFPSMVAYLSDHHVAVEGALAEGLCRSINVRANLGDDRSSKGNVGHEVAVHNVNVKPVCSLADGVRACLSQGAKVGAEDRGSDESGRSHVRDCVLWYMKVGCVYHMYVCVNITFLNIGTSHLGGELRWT